jgi:hypothetical protein
MTRILRPAGLSLVALTALALIILPARAVRSQDDKKVEKECPLEGAWKLIEAKNGDASEYQKLPAGTEQFKYVTGGRFIWVVVAEGRITSGAGGKVKVDKDKYSETIDYVYGENNASLVGKTFEFTWKMDGKTWLHTGAIKLGDQELKIDEKFERCD